MKRISMVCIRRILLAASVFTICTLLLCACRNASPDTSKGSSMKLSEEVSEDNFEWWKNTIAYEIYVKSFKDSDGDGIGDLNGIISELDHLKSLGVGAIWLTPCYLSPQADNGYDIADYYSIDPTYGTMDDMDNLIKEAGQRNIRIVMDLVFNHTSNENPWFLESKSGSDSKYSDWYIWRDPKEDGSAPNNWRSIFGGSAWAYDETRGQYYLHTFLPQQPDLNWENPEVRQALIDVADFWAAKGVGGFRMDAITYIKKPADFSDGKSEEPDGLCPIHDMTANTDGILDYLREFKNAVLQGTDLFTVGEANGIAPEDLAEWVGTNGVFDMVFEFSHILIDLPDENNWCEPCTWTLPQFKETFASSQQITLNTGGWYPMFLENHDQPRSISHFLPDGSDRIKGGKALAVLLMTMRGTPFIMQGEELGFVNVAWPSIDDYNDVSTKNHYYNALDAGYSPEQALEGVHRFSRDSSRTPMQWSGEANAGFTTGTPWLPVYEDYQVFNAESERSDPDSILNWYLTLSQLRGGHSEIVRGDYKELFPEDGQIFAYTRTDRNATATILINLSNEEAFYDSSCVENASLLAGSFGDSEKGKLLPLEAVIYEEKHES